jgi:hypothetical protein
VYEPRDLSGVHVAHPQPQLPSTLEREVQWQWQWRLISLQGGPHRGKDFWLRTWFSCARQGYMDVLVRVFHCVQYISLSVIIYLLIEKSMFPDYIFQMSLLLRFI